PLPPKRAGARTTMIRPAAVAILDESTLLARARDGDGASFEELMRRHRASAYRLAYRIMGSEPDADDVVQESFLAAWRGIGGFRGAASFSSWMYRIVVNRCSNLTRRRTPPVDVELLAETQPAPERDSPERRVEGNAALDALRRALAQLTIGQRACWILRELHHLSYPEIAQVVGASPTVVRGRLARARTDLAEAMQAWR
ncbi:MAG: RNA polymerase sigma factor, partial [Mycobacteriales bacterium]